MSNCPNCGAVTSPGAAFCAACGAPVPVQQPQKPPAVNPEDRYAEFRRKAQGAAAQQPAPQYEQSAQPYQQPAQPYQQPAQPYQQPAPQYQQPAPQYGQSAAPVAAFRTDRSLVKCFFLSLITLGIYGLICFGNVTNEVNAICSPHDGKKSMNFYLLTFIVGPITLEIATVVWMHNLCERIGAELRRRGTGYDFGAKDFWLWGVLGSLIIVGPFVFGHRFFTAMNKMNAHYNQFGG